MIHIVFAIIQSEKFRNIKQLICVSQFKEHSCFFLLLIMYQPIKTKRVILGNKIELQQYHQNLDCS